MYVSAPVDPPPLDLELHSRVALETVFHYEKTVPSLETPVTSELRTITIAFAHSFSDNTCFETKVTSNCQHVTRTDLSSSEKFNGCTAAQLHPESRLSHQHHSGHAKCEDR